MRRELWVVGEEAIRPAGLPDRCFYCDAKLGDEHNIGWVMRERTVMVEFTIKMPVLVPEDWTQENMENHWNNSGYCLSNMMNHVDEIKRGCLCGCAWVAYVGEATAEDEQYYGLSVEEQQA